MTTPSSNDLFGNLVDQLKGLTMALEHFEKYELAKDLAAKLVAQDAIILRTKAIRELILGNHQMTFPSDELLDLLNSEKYSVKDIHEILDFPIQSLKNFALSEMLRSSISE